MPGEGWFTILRLYSPLEPFFKEWRPSKIELVKYLANVGEWARLGLQELSAFSPLWEVSRTSVESG
jgi:hypothetical protein